VLEGGSKKFGISFEASLDPFETRDNHSMYHLDSDLNASERLTWTIKNRIQCSGVWSLRNHVKRLVVVSLEYDTLSGARIHPFVGGRVVQRVDGELMRDFEIIKIPHYLLIQYLTPEGLRTSR
jgi:hypothetical protein